MHECGFILNISQLQQSVPPECTQQQVTSLLFVHTEPKADLKMLCQLYNQQ